MRFCLLMFVAGVLGAANLHGATIDFQVTQLGANSSGNAVDQLTYTVSGLTLQPSQELDFLFNPAIYISLSDAVASSAYTVLLEQPNNPPGASGDFGLTPIMTNTSVTGPFSIDVTLKTLAGPGPQEFTVSQFDQNGNFVGVIASGFTTPVSGVVAPEPADWALTGIAVIFLSVLYAARFGFGKQSFQ